MSTNHGLRSEEPWRRWLVWAGRAVSLWPAYVVISSASWKLTHQPWYVAEWARIGYEERALTGLALVQLACLLLYLIPRTSVLGAVLLTGYLGGAISSYVRIGEPYPVLVPLSTSLVAWLGIYLREQRLWALLPVRWGVKRPGR
jgi:DoxX-like family